LERHTGYEIDEEYRSDDRPAHHACSTVYHYDGLAGGVRRYRRVKFARDLGGAPSRRNNCEWNKWINRIKQRERPAGRRR